MLAALIHSQKDVEFRMVRGLCLLFSRSPLLSTYQPSERELDARDHAAKLVLFLIPLYCLQPLKVLSVFGARKHLRFKPAGGFLRFDAYTFNTS